MSEKYNLSNSIEALNERLRNCINDLKQIEQMTKTLRDMNHAGRVTARACPCSVIHFTDLLLQELEKGIIPAPANIASWRREFEQLKQ